MKKDLQKERAFAVQRFLHGEKPRSICATIGKTTPWLYKLYKWMKRYNPENPSWCHNHSRKPHTNPYRTSTETEEIVKMVRLSLYNKGGLLWQSSHPLGDGRYGRKTTSLFAHH